MVSEMKNSLLLFIIALLYGANSAYGELRLEDGFEAGSFTQKSMTDGTGFSWGASSVSVSSAVSRSGNYSAEFVFGPNADGEDSWRELGFRLTKPVSVIWVEYWILYPDNYRHRSQSGPSNNKFFQLNYNGAPKQMLTIESEAQGNGTSAMRRFLSTTQAPSGVDNWPVGDSSTSNFIGDTREFAIEKGKWSRVLIYYKAGTDGVRNNGRAEVWVNDELVHGLDWPFWEPENQGKINGGYILGWSNSGFSEATRIYVDDFRVYDAPPGGDESRKPMPPSDFSVGN